MAIEIELYGNTEIIETPNTYNYIDFFNKIKHCGMVTKRGKNARSYYNMYMTFDIETTSVNNVEKPYAFMYLWQACINHQVIMGRTWEEWQLFMNNLAAAIQSYDALFVCYVHNLPFEFQFIRNFCSVSELFATAKRKPIKFIMNDVFEFRCSYKLSNMSLDKFIGNTPNAKYQKMNGEDFDYSIFRTPITKLTNDEYGYAYCDVRGLEEAIDYLLIDDTLATIPMTSTGYLRREVKKEMLKNPKNRWLVQNVDLSADQYILCKTALRGGNAHANPIYAGEILR